MGEGEDREDQKLNEARLEGLLRIGSFRAKDTQDLIAYTLSEAIALTGSEIGYIYRYDSADRRFTLNTWSADVMEQCRVRDKQTTTELDETGLWGEAVRQRAPILVNDFDAPHPLKRGLPDGHAPLRRFLSVPVFSGDDIVAVVGVANKAAPYSQSDIRQLSLMMASVWKAVERQEAEEKLRVSQEEFRAVFSASPSAILITAQEDAQLIDVNPAFERLFGYGREEAVGVPGFGLRLWGDPPVRGQVLKELDESATVEIHGLEMVKASGERFLADTLVSRIEIGGKPYAIALMNDVTERIAAERAVAESQATLRSLIDSTDDFVWSVDARDFGLLIWNRAMEENYRSRMGIELRAGLPFPDLFPPDSGRRETWRGFFRRALREGHFSQEYGIWAERRTLLLTFNLLRKGDAVFGITVFGKDITERKEAEAFLLNSQKLESLGILAGGIAHDFNNILSGFFGYVSLARDRTPEGAAAEYLDKASAALDRAKALTSQLLTFSTGGEPVKRLASLGPFLEDSVRFALAGSNVACEFDIAPDLWPCEYDRNLLGQVVDNLVINAKQAMPSGGVIRVGARNEEVGERPPLAPGRYALVSIADAGSGMAPEILPRIFDPFFTTKPNGHGLGLAACFSIISRHGGHIEAESAPGEGSVFRFWLPASPNLSAREEEPGAPAAGGEGRILVVDDEEIVREVVAGMLESVGYAAASAPDGRQGERLLSQAEREGRPFRAAVIDYTIPGDRGAEETLEAFRRIAPGLPVFIASGYADAPILADPLAYGFAGSIQKPFKRDELAALLKRSLDGAG